MPGRVRKPSQKAIEAAETLNVLAGVAESVPAASKKPRVSSSPAASVVSNKARKLARTPKKARKLLNLTDLPIELVTEIVSDLDHRDLYRLAHVSLSFRQLLLCPALDSVWQQAEDKLGFPSDLEQPMTRIQKAHLVHSGRCFYCHRTDVNKRQWHLKRIICANCIPTETTRPNRLYREINNLHPVTQEVIEPLKFKRVKFDFYKCEYDWHRVVPLEYINALNDVLNRDYPIPPHVKHGRNGGKFKLAQRNWAYEAGHEQLPEPGLVALVERHLDHREKSRIDGQELEAWSDARDGAKQNETETAKKNKKREIERRLVELGWTNEDFNNDWINGPPRVVTHPAPLTDALFRRMLPKLEEWVAPYRQERYRKHLAQVERTMRQRMAQEVYPKYVATCVDELLVLPLNPFLALDAAVELWKGYEDVFDLELTEEESSTLFDQAREAVRVCKRAIFDQACRSLKTSVQEIPLAKPFLENQPAVMLQDSPDLSDQELDQVLRSCTLPISILGRRKQPMAELNTHPSDNPRYRDDGHEKRAPLQDIWPHIKSSQCLNTFSYWDRELFPSAVDWASTLLNVEGRRAVTDYLDLVAKGIMLVAQGAPISQLVGGFHPTPLSWNCSCGCAWNNAGLFQSHLVGHLMNVGRSEPLEHSRKDYKVKNADKLLEHPVVQFIRYEGHDGRIFEGGRV